MFEKIKELCKEKGISVLTLEKEVGIAHGIHRWDISRPSVDKVKAVADYFGVTVDYLLSDDKQLDAKEELLERAFADNPDMRMLFKVTEKCSPAEIQTAIRLIQALRGEYKD